MIRGAVLALLAWVCLAGAGMAEPLAFPALTGRVVDEAGLLSLAERSALDASLTGLEAKTTDQLVVVTLTSLRGKTIEDYGYQLGRHWQIGQKDKDSGALLIVAANERKVRIEVGYGLEGTLTDALTRVIIEDRILPRFKVGDLAGGIKDGAAAIVGDLAGDATAPLTAGAPVPLQADRPRGSAPMWLVIVLALAGVGLVTLCAVTRGGGLCSAILQMLLLLALSGRGGASRGKGSFSGGGGSFGGGGSSGGW